LHQMSKQVGGHVLAAAAIFLLALVGGCAPLQLHMTLDMKHKRNECWHPTYLLGIGSSFAGGLLVAAGFIHLLPEAAEGLDNASGYPVSMLLCSIGLIGTMLLERAAHFTSAHNNDDSMGAEGSAPCRLLCPARSTVEDSQASTPPNDELPNDVSERHDEKHYSLSALGRKQSVDALTVAVTYAAFSFHSLIEGLALGVSNEVFQMFLAVSAHKLFAAFALGTSLTRGIDPRVRRSKWKLHCGVLAFALVTPIGIIAGSMLRINAPDGRIASMLIAIGAGTFLYMGLIEISVNELNQPQATYVTVHKMAALVTGYVLMALLGIWV